MVIDEHHVENALISCTILHECEDLHKDDGDGGGDAHHGHNVPLFKGEKVDKVQVDWGKNKR